MIVSSVPCGVLLWLFIQAPGYIAVFVWKSCGANSFR